MLCLVLLLLVMWDMVEFVELGLFEWMVGFMLGVVMVGLGLGEGEGEGEGKGEGLEVEVMNGLG